LSIVCSGSLPRIHLIADDSVRSLILSKNVEVLAICLVNVFSNSRKYKRERHVNDEVVIEISLKADRLFFSVDDAGKGIPMSALGKEFFQKGGYFVHPGISVDSTGMGLYFLNQLVSKELQGIISQPVSSIRGGFRIEFSFPTTSVKE
jgi:K+-sensing histidine kinase KdpD